MKNKKFIVVIDNTPEARAILESREFSPLSFFQGKKFLIANRSSNSNKDGYWHTYHYKTDNVVPKYPDSKTYYCSEDLDEFRKLLDELKPPIDWIERMRIPLERDLKWYKKEIVKIEKELLELNKETPTK